MRLPSISSIIFLGTDDVVALPAIRSIGTSFPRTTIHTLSIESENIQISNYSRYVSNHHSLGDLKEEALLDEVVWQIKSTKAEILLPADEKSTRFVSQYYDKLKDYVKLPPVASVNLLDTLIRKDKLAELLKTKNFHAVETYSIKGLDQQQLPNDFFPCLMKPIRGSGGINFIKINDHDGLENLLSRGNYDDRILQKLIQGGDIGCNILAVDGKIKAYTIQRGFMKDGYSFSKGLCFEDNKILFNQVEKFIREINYNGIANLDYRFDDRDGIPRLIDFNARYWSNLEGSKEAGVDFAVLNCLEALGVNYHKPHFRQCNYLLGNAVYSRIKSQNRQLPTFTDLKSRITDPVPELLRIFGK